jgi:tetratricopeptide (TPR) repeat protein
MVQSLGRAQALISQIEIDYPGQLPVVAWEGARGGNPGRSVHDAIAQRAAQMRAHQNAQPSSGEPKPIQPEEDMADRVVDQATADNLAKLHGPLLGLRDGVDQLEEARRNIERIAVKQADGRATDGGILASELAPDQTIEGHQLPFRFVHGYTLPKHWARRDNEIEMLVEEIRANRCSIVSLIAIGGTGKSALTRKLLDELPNHHVKVDGALWFSFYVEPEFDRFLTEACRYLIPDFDPIAHPSPYEKGVLLREAMDHGHYLLVLDGIEVLLVSDRSRKDFGSFLDRAFREFLEGVSEGSTSQILISSRWPITDLEGSEGHRVLQLADLSIDAAEELLESYGVTGSQRDRRNICDKYGTHALTLQIIADFLARFHEGNPHGVEDIGELPKDATQGIKLQACLDTYWQHLQPDERFFLTRMSAFRGGVDERSFLVLNKSGDVFNPEFRAMVTRVIKSPLVSVERRDGKPRLTAHPLIKTFFYERMGDLEKEQTHRALKDYAQGLPLPDRPNTLADYDPLLEACHHCLQVGLYTEAYHIYRRNNMDNALRWWGHYARAQELLEPLRDASQGASPAWQTERWQKSWVENETALIAMLRGDTNLAMERFRNSADMDAQFNDGLGESASWQNLASVLTQRGQFWDALAALEKSRSIEVLIGRYEKEDMLAGLEGVCHAELGQVQHALELLTRALGISAQRPNFRAMCYWTWRLADLYQRVRRPDRASSNFQEALKLAHSEQFRDYEAHVLRGLGDCARNDRNLSKARSLYDEALRIARTLGNPYVENEVRLGTARLNLEENNLHDAEIQAQQVLDRSEECGYQVQLTDSHLILAASAKRRADVSRFERHAAAAQQLLESTSHFWGKQEFERLGAAPSAEPSLSQA